MADFEFTNPTPGESPGTWGAELNAILDILKAHPGIKLVADEAARLAVIPFKGQVVLQLDTMTFYKCTNELTPVWEDAVPVKHTTRGIAFYINGNISVNVEASFIAPCALTISNIKSNIGVAPTGAALIMDVLKNGVTVFTTTANRPTIADGETTGDSATPDVTSIVAGDRITLKIVQIGSLAAGADLAATLICEVV